MRAMAYDPTDILARQQAEQAAADAAAKSAAAEADDLRWLVSDKRGRRILARLIRSTGVNQRSHTGNSETFFREGRRSVGIELQERLEADHFEEYILMLKENHA